MQTFLASLWQKLLFLPAFLKVESRRKVEMYFYVFSGLVCGGSTSSFMIAISVFSQLFL